MSGISDRNPFVGPRPIEEGDAFYGRDAEVSELFHQLQARRIVVLHSPSGAGKSSLVQAGLIPRLRGAGFDVWPPIRVNHEAQEAGAGEAPNRYLLSALLSLEVGIPEQLQRSEAELAELDLKTYIGLRPRRKRLKGRPVVLIFDQFEEILTTDPRAVEQKRAFFDAVGEALDEGGAWALFVMREDYLGAFAPYRERVPTHMSNSFRLDMLTREGARAAAARAALDGGREFPAVDQLIADLSRVTVQSVDGEASEGLGHYVEPVHLQVVCRRLWEAMPPDADRIEAEHISAFADVSTALGGYYADAVATAAAGDEAAERAIREWAGVRLLAGGIRSPVRREPGQSGGLDNRYVEALVDAYLVRTEQRAGAMWYELSHDRMVEPVLADNAAWDEAHLHPSQVRARLWEGARRAPSMLLGAEDLPTAAAWAKKNPSRLTEGEGEYLTQSIEARDRDRRARRLRNFAFLAVFLGMIASFGFALYARDLAQQASAAEARALTAKDKAIASEQKARAKEQAAVEAEAAARASEARAKEQQELANTAKGEAEEAATRATSAEAEARRQAAEALAQKSAAELAEQAARDGLYMQAVSRLQHDPSATLPFLARVQAPAGAAGWREAALDALSQTLPTNVLRAPEGSAPGSAVAMSADRSLVAAGQADGRVMVWRRERPSHPEVLAEGPPGIRQLAIDGSGERVAWISADTADGRGSGRVWTWSAAEGRVTELKAPDGSGAWALAMSSDGALAVGRSDGSVWLHASAGATPQRLGQLGRGVMALAWLPDARLVVATQTELYLVRSADAAGFDAPRFTLEGSQLVSRVACSADGQRVAVLTARREVLAGSLSDAGALTALRGVKDVSALAFVGPDHGLALGYLSGEVGLLPEGELPEARLLGHTGSVLGLAASGDARFVSLSEDGTLRVWPTRPREEAPAQSTGLDALASQIAQEADLVCVALQDRVEFLNEAASDAQALAAACTDRLEL